MACWSSGMIPASGAGGPGFNSQTSPSFLLANSLRDCTSERLMTITMSFKVHTIMGTSEINK